MADYYFDKWLREKREDRGLNQPQLAKLAHTTKQTISNIERQAPHPVTGAPYRPKRNMVDALADALNESRDDARLAAGYAAEGEKANGNRSDIFSRLRFKHSRINSIGRRREFERVLKMVERDYDRELLRNQHDNSADEDG